MMSHHYSSFTSNNNSLVVDYNSDNDDEEDIGELMRRNGILPAALTVQNSGTVSQSLNNHYPQQHVVVTPPKAAKTEWNENHSHHFDNTQITTTLPPALLKLDQQHAIPTLRHCNDILIEIEACTVEPRRCMIRPGVRGGGDGDGRKRRDTTAATKEDGNEQQQQQEQLMEVVTTSVDCIGRVVQLAEHNSHFATTQQRQQKIHHDIQINDRIAAIHPFEYKLDKKNQLLLSRQNAHNHSSNHQRYTLVDAGHTVKLPQSPNNFLENNAAASACMIRVYTTAFQSLQLGILSPASVMSSYLTNHRYSCNQLRGKSILIQNGTSEMGRAWIQLCRALGATHIFATTAAGSTSSTLEEEQAVLRDELNVIPLVGLGTESLFDGGELFREEKLNLILIQELTSHDFDVYFSLLDDTRGVLVYCPWGDDGENADRNEEDRRFGELGYLGCSGGGNIPSFQDLANKARDVLASTKFSLRLTCSPQFVTYRGIWASCKEDHGLYRKDLSFLFKLLEEGKLKPHVEECISPEDIPSVQNRIELEGKRGTVVCLPAPLYEKKAVNVVSPFNSSEAEDVRHFNAAASRWNEDVDGGMVTDAERYAADSGYIVSHYKQPSIQVAAATVDDDCKDLSDFRCMNDLVGQPTPFRPRLSSNGSDSLQIEQTQSFSTFTSVSTVSVKAHEFLRDYNLFGRK